MPSKKNLIKFNSSINFALKKALKKDNNLICFGLGINDQKYFWNNIKFKRNFLEIKEYLMYLILKML